MGRPLWSINFQERGAWNSDQAAFRFYSALLTVDDTVAGICTGEAPELLQYHVQLVTNDSSAEGKPPLTLEELVGCENWVILQMDEIAALNAWKKAAKEAGSLDMMELVARASAIQRTLLENLARLDAAVDTSQSGWLGFFRVYNDQLPPMPGGCAVFVTRVWAHAALLYLAVSVSGWQPGSAAVRENVTRILALPERMPAPELLRKAVWLYCIMGCLCEPAEEFRVRAMAEALVPHRLFGAARKALEIMENVWKRRDDLTVETTLRHASTAWVSSAAQKVRVLYIPLSITGTKNALPHFNTSPPSPTKRSCPSPLPSPSAQGREWGPPLPPSSQAQATTSRRATEGKSSERYLSIKADLSNPSSVPAVLDVVKAEFKAAPNVVIYNVAAFSLPAGDDSTKEIVKGWATLTEDAKKVFIYTGNKLNTWIASMPLTATLGVGKRATSYLIGSTDARYVKDGYRFFYADERNPNGSIKGTAIDGEAHADFFAQLASGEGEIPWHATFVKGQGYTKFE
ncbi:hypothetical protein PMIN04_008210 [Paraphaeosphaeria minitans]